MTITRKLIDINVTFQSDGTPVIMATGVISDDVEGTSSGLGRDISAIAAVKNAAITLRDAVIAAAVAAGKPVTT